MNKINLIFILNLGPQDYTSFGCQACFSIQIEAEDQKSIQVVSAWFSLKAEREKAECNFISLQKYGTAALHSKSIGFGRPFHALRMVCKTAVQEPVHTHMSVHVCFQSASFEWLSLELSWGEDGEMNQTNQLL